jgi:hypothetical protein
MTKRYNYKVFPTTWKAWILLGGAFALGGLMLAGYFAFFVFFSLSDWLDEVDVTYVNQTDQQITVYIDDVVEVTVPANGSVTESYYRLEWWFDRTVTARDPSGRVIVALRIDDDDLEDTDWRISFDNQ